MTRFIVLTFGLLGFAWYEMSGGADFKAGPEMAPMASVEEETLPEVARAETGATDLTTVSQVRAQPEKAEPVKPAAVIIPLPKLDITLAAASPVAAKPALAEPATQVAAVAVATDAAPSVPELEVLPDLREVAGSRVNMRNGPSTEFHVVDQLVRGDRVEVLNDPGQGWVKLKALESNRIGWMAVDFLEIAAN